jgi:hypothetical protein
MPTIREQFHTIANWHNKITIAAGCTKELLLDKPLDTLTKEELKTQQQNLVKALGDIENNAVTADQIIQQLKTFIYAKIDPQTQLPIP